VQKYYQLEKIKIFLIFELYIFYLYLNIYVFYFSLFHFYEIYSEIEINHTIIKIVLKNGLLKPLNFLASWLTPRSLTIVFSPFGANRKSQIG
jgi:hypothetical protein